MWNELRRRLAILLHRDRFQSELEEEMNFHLEMQVEESGLDSAAARRRFGNATALRESGWEQWGWGPLERFWQDLRYAWRGLRKNPAFTAAATLTLAVGIGANTAVFSVVNAVVFRPLPFGDPGRLVMLWENWARNGKENVVVSAPIFNAWRQNRSFECIAAMRNWGAGLKLAGEPTNLPAPQVSAEFFQVLGVQPFLGRTFAKEELHQRGPRTVVLGHAFWQRLGADPRLVGKTLLLNGDSHVVVGVMPRGFDFPDRAEMWFPMPEEDLAGANDDHYLRVVGKLRSGTPLAQARSEFDTIMARMRQSNHEAGVLQTTAALVPLKEQVVGHVQGTLLVLFGAVSCVLLIACANVANLLLARAAARAREVALQAALGASRARLVRFLLTESLLLALMGSVLGLAGAYWIVRAFVALDPVHLPRLQEIAIDRGVLAFALLLAGATGVLFGLAPAWRAVRGNLSGRQDFRASGRRTGRGALAVAQIALAMVLLTCAGLLLRSFILRVNVPLGFRPSGLLGVELPWSAHRQLEPLVELLRALPGVLDVGASTAFPQEDANTTGGFEIEGQVRLSLENIMAIPKAGKWVVTPGYFRAAGMTLRQGRLLSAADSANTAKVVVINRALARRYLPGRDPVGLRLNLGNRTWRTIAGVVDDVKGFGVDGDSKPAIYMPFRQEDWHNPVYLLVRTAVPPAGLVRPVRREIRSLNKDWVIERLAPLETLLADSVAVPRFYLLLVTGFAGVALAVAGIGLYGIMNYSVAQRTHELGVRMALGAQRRDVLRMVLGNGLALTLAGAGIGLLGAWSATRLLENLLFQVHPNDPRSFLGAVAVLILAGLLAAYLPARRATRIQPMEALRYE